jgi:hypothetical protein
MPPVEQTGKIDIREQGPNAIFSCRLLFCLIKQVTPALLDVLAVLGF